MQRPTDPSKPSLFARLAKLSGLGVFGALILTSGAAYVWPTQTIGFDPFRLPSVALLSLVGVTMFCLGLVVQSAELEELRKRPATVLLGVVVQCTVMPALAWLVVRMLSLEGALAHGVMLCGCVPGAMASNVLTMTARGNVSYSVSLTTVATLLSPITVPIALTVIAGLDAGSDVFRPTKMAVTLLLTVVLPVVVGYLLKHNISRVRTWGDRGAPLVATIALLWIIASVVAGNRDRLAQVAPLMLLALLAMNVLGYLAGFSIGRLFRMPMSMCRALTLEVGMQNAGLGTALAASVLGGDSSSQIPTAAYTFGCMLTGTVLASYWSQKRGS